MAMVLAFLLVITFVIAMRNNDERDLCFGIIEWELFSLATTVIILCGIHTWIPLTYAIMLLAVPITFGIVFPHGRSCASIFSDPESIDKWIYKSEFDLIIREGRNRWQQTNSRDLLLQRKQHVKNATFIQEILYGWFSFGTLSRFNIYQTNTSSSTSTTDFNRNPQSLSTIIIPNNPPPIDTGPESLPIGQIFCVDLIGNKYTIDKVEPYHTLDTLKVSIYHKTGVLPSL